MIYDKTIAKLESTIERQSEMLRMFAAYVADQPGGTIRVTDMALKRLATKNNFTVTRDEDTRTTKIGITKK